MTNSTQQYDSQTVEDVAATFSGCFAGNHPKYGQKDYWDTRYRRQPGHYEWYQSYSALRSIFSTVFTREGHLLQMGVGTSKVQEDMAKDGYTSITNVDYSETCIELMQQVSHCSPVLSYIAADARNLPFERYSFDGIFEKGLLDTVLCGTESQENACTILEEAHRVLRQGSPLVVISYGEPESRLTNFDPKMWSVEVYTLTRPTSCMEQDDAQLDGPIVQQGPYAAQDKERMDHLSMSTDTHFVYVLWKKN